ncbi:hypothetical protein [Kineococcus aurantiacus]|uniref:AAA domain-containing protein n=1 Tax=Kineococcus aurantiacus TaxID=37633 RepID=A0A7Y9DJS6_9ACTN|nr:hypothetical protein [Kineococcus aurantiacus]NYD21568.1 hypothetical protein [Kineococcus aurantiacus]
MTSTAATGPDSTRRRWWAEAEALGGTSALLDCPVGTDAVLDLTTAHPSGLAQLLAGGPAPLTSLVREAGAFAEARRRARTTHRLAGALLAQRGTRSLAVAVGTAGWSLAADVDARDLAEAAAPPALRPPRRTPVLLRRCTLTPATEALDDFVVQLAPEVVVNPVLVRTARTELGVALDTRRIAAAVGAHWGFDPNPAMDELRRQLAGVRGLRVERRLLLGTFADPGADLLADLRRRGALVRDHRVVAALAEQRPVEPRPAGDAPVPPVAGGFPLDPAQRQAVEAVLAGGDLRLHAPTGTGATQVAAAVIASEVAAGRSVLLVADSAADRRAVDERLRDHGYGRLLLHLVGDLDTSADDAGVQRAAARRELQARSGAGRDVPADPDVDGPGTALDEHARALHRLREPWAVSAAEAVEALLTLAERPVPPTTSRRLRGEALSGCSRADVAHWQAVLVEAVELGAFDVDPGTSAWAGASLRTPEAAAQALGRVEELLDRLLPAARALLATVCDAAGLRGAASVADAVERAELLDGVRTTVEHFGTEVFARSLGDVAAATATPQWRRDHEVRQGWVRRWKLRREARALLRADATTGDLPTLHDWLQAARAQRLRWQRVSVRDNVPGVPEDLDELITAVGAVRHELTELTAVLPERSWTELGAQSLLDVQLPELTALLRRLAADAGALRTLPRRTVLLDELEAAGWGGLLEDLRARWTGPGSLDLPSEVESAWWAGVLDAISMVDPLVGTGEAASLRSARHELQLAVAARRRRRAAAVRADLDARAGSSDEHLLPVPALSAAGVAALATAVPDADLLVVLGAQATTTASALPALSRGRRVLVVGDPDLPGPADVATARDEQSVSRPVAESLFADAGAALPTLRLDRQHALLDDTLLTAVPVPVAGTSLPGPGHDGRATARTSDRPPGARRGPDALVDLVLDTAVAALRAHPEESLGIVVPDAAGAELLADTVRRRALDLGLPLAVGREPLLVGTPVRWTGERRDHVLVVTDAVLNGPALGAAGEGGEGVPTGRAEAWMALTRSRLRTTLVLDDSGWSADREGRGDVADGRALLAGTAEAWERDELLAQEPGRGVEVRRGADAVVRALAAACRRAGLPVECEVGTSRRLALVVRDERARAGVGPALAVELDSASWAAADVVDREVDGPAELERRGWRYVRVLTADVFADADAEAERIAAVWRDALADAGFDLPWVVDLTAAGREEVVDLAVERLDAGAEVS